MYSEDDFYGVWKSIVYIFRWLIIVIINELYISNRYKLYYCGPMEIPLHTTTTTTLLHTSILY